MKKIGKWSSSATLSSATLLAVAGTLFVLVLLVLLIRSVKTNTFVSPVSPIGPGPEGFKTPTPAPTPDGGLLLNPSFEHPYNCPTHSADCAAHGWTAWWVWPPACTPGSPGCFISCPSNCWVRTPSPAEPAGKCAVDWGCYWTVPEFGEVTLQYPERVHSGISAQKTFAFGRMGEWGVYQRVRVPFDATVEFSVWMQAWMCFDYNQCAAGRVSDAPTTMHLRVGIDPTGGTVPTSTHIAWSGEADSFNQYSQLSVTAQAQGEWITVFTYARPEWPWARNNNDVYLDDARLVVIPTMDRRLYLPLLAR